MEPELRLDAPVHRCARHPDRAAVATCDLCGALCCEPCVTLDGERQLCATCRDAGRAEAGGIPWEQRRQLGVAVAAWRTLVEVSLRPARLLAGAAGPGTASEAVGFLALVLVPATLTGTLYFWLLTQAVPAADLVLALLDSFGGGLPADVREEVRQALEPSARDLPFQMLQQLAFGLPMTLLFLFLLSVVQHALLAVLGGARHPHSVTLKVVLYAAAVRAWEVIPGLYFVATLWAMTVAGLGLGAAHGAPTWKGLAATWGLALATCGACGAVSVAFGLGLAALAA